jgi:tRNA dimethylallyltransferase
MSSLKSVVVLGPTASGKSDVAMTAAQEVGRYVHIVAADAMQVYSRMDIGTAKPTAADRVAVVHHGLDLAEPSERYTVARYMDDIATARALMQAQDATELIVGGTGLYVTAIVDGLSMPGEWPDIRAELEANDDTEALFAQLSALDPEAVTKMEPNNRRRIVRALEVCLGSGEKFSSFGDGIGAFPDTATKLIGIRWNRDALRERIGVRVHKMVSAGLVDEVRSLLAEPNELSATARQALGYKEVIEFLDGRWTLDEAIDATILRTQQFAVRQERWYRRDPRIQWVEVQNDPIAEVTPVVVAALA